MPNQSLHSLPLLCDPREVATLFKVSRRTVYAWVDNGRLPALRLHGRLRFDRSTLSTLLQPNPDNPAGKS